MTGGVKPQPLAAPPPALSRRQVGEGLEEKGKIGSLSPPTHLRRAGPRTSHPRTPRNEGFRQNIAATRLPTAREDRSPRQPGPQVSRASPGAGSAGTLLWRPPRLCSPATQFSAQFPTLIPPRKIMSGSQAEAGRAGGPQATHAGALRGGARATLRPAAPAPAPASVGFRVQGHIVGHPEPGCTKNLRDAAPFSNLQALAAWAGRWGSGDSGPLQ